MWLKSDKTISGFEESRLLAGKAFLGIAEFDKYRGMWLLE